MSKLPYSGKFSSLLRIAQHFILNRMVDKHSNPSPTRPPFKNQIWIHRKKMGYSQQDIATLLGHQTAAHVSGYERGVRLPSLKTVLKLELILCVPAAFLYNDLYHELKQKIIETRSQPKSQNNE